MLRGFCLWLLPSLLKKKMRYPPISFLRPISIPFIASFVILFLGCLTANISLCLPIIPSSLETLSVDGHFSFHGIEHAARDFGNRYQFLPQAVLHPKSVSDIATTIKHVWQMGPGSELTVAARGHGHSLQGQAQAHQGVVINMESLQGTEMQVYTGNFPYVDVSGGELWINILHESLKYGLAPKSWTDYLHLTVGGTLSNAGISGQAFRHGPQISNVHWLEVVTGKGEVINCSKKQHGDLFHSVLGGLGQFGIITRARISLEPAPKMVKWIRVLYSDFSTFARDQEYLISCLSTWLTLVLLFLIAVAPAVCEADNKEKVHFNFPESSSIGAKDQRLPHENHITIQQSMKYGRLVCWHTNLGLSCIELYMVQIPMMVASWP